MMNTVLPFFRKFFTFFFTVFLLSNSLFAQNWMSIDRLIASDWEAGDNIGISIAIDGEYMISGAWWEDNVPFVNSAGAAYVFKKDNMNNWSEVTKLVSPNAETLGYFGFSVAIDGEYAAVAAYNEDEDDGTTVTGNAGAVYIYHLESNNWVMDQRLIASDYGQGDLFGYNIALSGNYLLVGAFSDDEDANGNNTMDNAGSAYVFERQPNGDWQEVAKLVASDRAAGDDFGKFVDIREDRAIIGAMNKNDDPNFYFSAGAAYIFERNNSNGAWEETQKILASDRGSFDNFGWDVAIDGDKAFIGARAETDIPGGGTASNTGAAYFFLRNSSGIWEETQKIYASDHAQNDFFGGALDLDGNIAVIGAEMEDHDPSGGDFVSGAGSAYIYERQPNGIWQEVQKVIGQGREINDLFGASVSVREDQIAIGAWLADEPDGQDLEPDVGATYIFKRNTPLSTREDPWAETIKIAPNPSDGKLTIFPPSLPVSTAQICVYNLYGNLVFEQTVDINSSMEIDLKELPAAMYLVSLKNEHLQTKPVKWTKF